MGAASVLPGQQGGVHQGLLPAHLKEGAGKYCRFLLIPSSGE